MPEIFYLCPVTDLGGGKYEFLHQNGLGGILGILKKKKNLVGVRVINLFFFLHHKTLGRCQGYLLPREGGIPRF